MLRALVAYLSVHHQDSTGRRLDRRIEQQVLFCALPMCHFPASVGMQDTNTLSTS